MHVIFVAGTCSRARRNSKIANKKNYGVLGAKRTHPKGGFTSRGAKRRVRFEKSRTRRVHSHAHAHAHTCACRRACTHAHKCACRRVRTHAAPFGCMKSTHPKNNRTLTPAHTCDRVKIVRAESAPRMRTPAVSSRARARIYMHPKGACIRTEGAVYEPRSEAESAPRKRKTKLAMRMHRRCIR